MKIIGGGGVLKPPPPSSYGPALCTDTFQYQSPPLFFSYVELFEQHKESMGLKTRKVFKKDNSLGEREEMA